MQCPHLLEPFVKNLNQAEIFNFHTASSVFPYSRMGEEWKGFAFNLDRPICSGQGHILYEIMELDVTNRTIFLGFQVPVFPLHTATLFVPKLNWTCSLKLIP